MSDEVCHMPDPDGAVCAEAFGHGGMHRAQLSSGEWAAWTYPLTLAEIRERDRL